VIVDDESAVRDLMARWVASLRLQPRSACDAIAELLRAAPSQADPDIVIAFLTVLTRQGEAAGCSDLGPRHPTSEQSPACPPSASIH
jgi:CheY-like chemotaxis protein